MSSIRSTHLVNIEQAKAIIHEKLQPRIDEYEARLKKNKVIQFFEYFHNFYGKEGYKRTLLFLADMKNIETTEGLINLIQTPKYSKGTNMPQLLKEAVLLMCGVARRHIELIENDVKCKIIEDNGLKGGTNLLQAEEDAVDEIYSSIITSDDYGARYLKHIDDRLIAYEKAQERANQPVESVEMRVFRKA